MSDSDDTQSCGGESVAESCTGSVVESIATTTLMNALDIDGYSLLNPDARPFIPKSLLVNARRSNQHHTMSFNTKVSTIITGVVPNSLRQGSSCEIDVIMNLFTNKCLIPGGYVRTLTCKSTQELWQFLVVYNPHIFKKWASKFPVGLLFRNLIDFSSYERVRECLSNCRIPGHLLWQKILFECRHSALLDLFRLLPMTWDREFMPEVPECLKKVIFLGIGTPTYDELGKIEQFCSINLIPYSYPGDASALDTPIRCLLRFNQFPK